uniref:Uncharacterized protein n=2 Tax=Cannabis sativa TaxID=3483 RepID=A0A803RB14_CANSA
MALQESTDESPKTFSIGSSSRASLVPNTSTPTLFGTNDTTNTTQSNSTPTLFGTNDSNPFSSKSFVATNTTQSNSTPTLFGTNNTTPFSSKSLLGNTNTTQQNSTPLFGCGFNFRSSSTSPSHGHGQPFFFNGQHPMPIQHFTQDWPFPFSSSKPFGTTTQQNSTPLQFGCGFNFRSSSTSPNYHGHGQPLFFNSQHSQHLDHPMSSMPIQHFCNRCGHKSFLELKEIDGPNCFEVKELLNSISSMPFYQHKSHEEFRWEDYNQKKGKCHVKKGTTTSEVLIKVRHPSRFYILLKKVLSFVAILVIARLLVLYLEE